MEGEVDADGDESELQYGRHEQRLGVVADLLHHDLERVQLLAGLTAPLVQVVHLYQLFHLVTKQ